MVSVIMLALWVTGTAFEGVNEKLLGTVLPFRIRQFMDTYFWVEILPTHRIGDMPLRPTALEAV